MLSYSELIKIDTFDKRLEYLRLWDVPHVSPRNLSLSFYKHKQWLHTREIVIKRDYASDLGMLDISIYGPIYVHHINPLTEQDILEWSDRLFNLDNLICCSLDTHNAIHYKKELDRYVERTPGDTILW